MLEILYKEVKCSRQETDVMKDDICPQHAYAKTGEPNNKDDKTTNE